MHDGILSGGFMYLLLVSIRPFEGKFNGGCKFAQTAKECVLKIKEQPKSDCSFA